MRTESQLISALNKYKTEMFWKPQHSDDPQVQALWSEFKQLRTEKVRAEIAKAKANDGVVDAKEMRQVDAALSDPFSGNTLPVAKDQLLQLYASDAFVPDYETTEQLERTLYYQGLDEVARPSDTFVDREIAKFRQLPVAEQFAFVYREWDRQMQHNQKFGRSSSGSKWFLKIFGFKALTHFGLLNKVKAALQRDLGGGKVKFSAAVYERNGKPFAYAVTADQSSWHIKGGIGTWTFLNIFLPQKHGTFTTMLLDPDTLKPFAQRRGSY